MKNIFILLDIEWTPGSKDVEIKKAFTKLEDLHKYIVDNYSQHLSPSSIKKLSDKPRANYNYNAIYTIIDMEVVETELFVSRGEKIDNILE